MSLLAIILTLLAVGVLLFLINTYGKSIVDANVLKLINIVVIVLLILWLLRIFGVREYLSKVSV